MARTAKTVGMILLAVGLAALIGFSAYVVRDEQFSKAALLKERNPGNVLYESQYFVAATIRVFLIAGAVGGALLALNGATLLLVGSVAARQDMVAAREGGPRGDRY